MPNGVLPGLRRVLGAAARERPAGGVAPAYKREFLREIDIFRDLAPYDMAWLEQTTRMTTVRKGQTIYRQDDTAEGLFLLKQGRVRLSRHSPGGKKLDLAILEPGTFFGEMPLLGERMRHASAEALDDCTLCVMSQADIEALVLRTPAVALRMLAVVGRRLAESEARLEDLAYRSVPARLASVLLRLGREHQDVIEGMTHQDLGDMVGAYRETVTKTLDEFQAAGCVELGRRRIRILKRDELALFLDQ